MKRTASHSMAASSSLLPLLLLAATLVVAKPSSSPVAAPSAGPLNITDILVNATRHRTFARLLRETQVDLQVDKELGDDDTGNTFTVLAPSDAAFLGLRSGVLNALSQQDQEELVLYHLLPHYYSLPMFVTASNPVRTQASGNHGAYTLNVTTDNDMRVNVSTGVVRTPIAGSLFDDGEKLAVYTLEKVLLPYDLFGPRSPASSKPDSKVPSAQSAADVAPAAGENIVAAAGLRACRRNLMAAFGALAIAIHCFASIN
ncbi:fasciclin-like arabinogalactan protein 9 [Zingiber officinale]|uniref:FAS1 domain-containing protein n=1 Tax=Zingiber officinale TaxID=94328 RepID=A0A8J5L2B0_ZINOF|nr:fasciclin-like arabinogalactan protein 9 [Zingiber officinale]KAG6502662.1 hypothetical protein ZIOFF_034948 [Zingiber officinale]